MCFPYLQGPACWVLGEWWEKEGAAVQGAQVVGGLSGGPSGGAGICPVADRLLSVLKPPFQADGWGWMVAVQGHQLGNCCSH